MVTKKTYALSEKLFKLSEREYPVKTVALDILMDVESVKNAEAFLKKYTENKAMIAKTMEENTSLLRCTQETRNKIFCSLSGFNSYVGVLSGRLLLYMDTECDYADIVAVLPAVIIKNHHKNVFEDIVECSDEFCISCAKGTDSKKLLITSRIHMDIV